MNIIENQKIVLEKEKKDSDERGREIEENGK